MIATGVLRKYKSAGGTTMPLSKTLPEEVSTPPHPKESSRTLESPITFSKVNATARTTLPNRSCSRQVPMDRLAPIPLMLAHERGVACFWWLSSHHVCRRDQVIDPVPDQRSQWLRPNLLSSSSIRLRASQINPQQFSQFSLPLKGRRPPNSSFFSSECFAGPTSAPFPFAQVSP